MIYSDTRFTLDIRSVVSQVSFGVKKGETGRRLRIHLTDNGNPYNIPKNSYAVFTARKSDGNPVANDCIIRNGEIIYDITEQTISATGVLHCAINLYGAEGGLLISPCFDIVVHNTVIAPGAGESTPEFNALNDLISRGNTLIAEVENKLANGDFVGAPGQDGEDGEDGGYYTPTIQQSADGSVVWGFTPSKDGMPGIDDVQLNVLGEEAGETIKQLVRDVADLKYVPIDITSITNNVGTVEIGRTITSVGISWTTNRAPASQTVEGEAVDAAARSVTLEGLALTTARSFAVTATDERDATDTASTKVNFYNGVYSGPLVAGVVPDSAEILALSKKLQSGRGVTINYTPADGKRPSYACPTRCGTPKFVIGGFEYAWTKLGTIDFTNASGYTESYDVWQHPQDVTASMTITVS